MRLLVHTAHPQALEHAGPGFGRLLSPRQFSRARDTAASGIPWAADNDAYSRWDEDAYRRMLATLRGVPGGLFVTAPDVVADATATRHLYDRWADELDGLPVAYVIQDGEHGSSVPWDRIAAVFVGGSTAYKLSAEAERLVREAKVRGLHAHMGRVNGRARFAYARAIGVDSVDGSSFSRWRRAWLPAALGWQYDPLQERLAL